MVYVIVISWARVMYGVYCTKPEGTKCTRAEVSKCYASRVRKYPMGTATIHMFRRQENQKKDELILHKTVPRSHSLSQLLNVDQPSD